MKFHKYLSTNGLPPIIEARCRGITLPGLLFLLVGAIMGISSLLTGKSISIVLMPVLLGAMLLIYGAAYKYSAVSKGIIEISGCCDRHCHLGLQSLTKASATGFGLNAVSAIRYEYHDGNFVEVCKENISGVIYVPLNKKKNIPYVGQPATVYVSAKSISYEDNSGMTNYNQIFGYIYG